MKNLHFLGDGLLTPASVVFLRRVVRLCFLGGGLALAYPCAGGSGVFENTGSLVATHGTQATLLPDGKVLVMAGGGTIIVPSEIYDPGSGTWTTGGLEPDARASHTATLLPNGKVLVAAGASAEPSHVLPLSSARLYDPASGNWAATGNLGSARYYHTATLLPNGKVLVAGGLAYDFISQSTFPLASAELYDPVLETWTATGNLGSARDRHTATLLPNGKVLVAGGDGGGESAELYDPLLETWTATGSLSTARAAHTATLLPNGKVLVAGGLLASAELYDPSTGQWTMTGSPSTERYLDTATLLPTGQVLVAGGIGLSGGNPVVLAGAELYDPTSGTWAATGNLVTGREGHSATLLPNGNVLIAAGGVMTAELYVRAPTPPTLLNISTRMRVLTDDKVLIGGFIITGTDLKRVLIRGLGPSLTGVGVTLTDPTLEVHQGDVTLATNDNWKMRSDGTSQQADIDATTIPPTNDAESAILVMLSPGAYTAVLAGNNGETGVGLVEVYDLGQGACSRPVNISTRGFVDTGDNVMIGGLIVGGGSGIGTARVMVRAIGPSLPIAGALGDPTLELHDSNGASMASNDNWRIDQEAEIIATGIAPSNDLESAIVQTLTPGNYTAIVRGANDTTGVGLVEAYDLN